MKIYELRDSTDSENYYVYGFYSTKEKAIEVMGNLRGDINDFDEDYVVAQVYEHELDSDKKQDGILLIERTWERNYDDEPDSADWKLVNPTR